ncbi:putative serine protein kinase, PrkA [Sulfobacillus acidophilus TPY]|nr:putative serine protein kinase, PrkA [Sulfobacillus acidophilus TPY]
MEEIPVAYEMSLPEDHYEPRPWSGTFAQYLERVERAPYLADTAHRRLYRMIMAKGGKSADGRYPFFADHLYGIDETLTMLVEEYLKPAALGYDVKKRILLLVGPVSGGKSSLVTLLKRGLEEFSRTDAGALYGIQGCPMHEEPLHLVPDHARQAFGARLGVTIEGQLCPWCRHQVETVYRGRIDEVPVERVILSESRRVGIGTYAPSDPKSQDISDLTGSVDFQAIAQFGSESDPRAFRFDGELNIANRGLMEFQEMLKLDEKFLYHLLSLSQEGNFKTGRYELISADEVIIGHTNEHEYRAFLQNPRNEALASRLFVVPVPYNLDHAAEVKIYEKLLAPYATKGRHVAPYAIDTVAAVAILSRIEESPKPGGDRLSKFLLYLNPEDTERYQEFRREGWYQGEGMKGLDPRYIINRLAVAFSATDVECIDALDLLDRLQQGIDANPFWDRQERGKITEWIRLAREWYDRRVESEVLEAFARDWSEELTNLYQNYVDNVVRAVKSGPGNRHWDEALLRSVEERMGVSEIQAPAFREELYTRIEMAKKQHQALNFLEHPGLYQALRQKLFDDLRDEVKITTEAPAPDRQLLERIEKAAERMVAGGRYCPRCASRAIHHVGSLLNR